MKKLISIFLVLVLVIGIFPTVALVPAQAANHPYGSVPILIGDPETDLMADRLLETINVSGLSERDKILKVYDWIIENCVRERDGMDIPWLEGPSETEIAAYSAQMLNRLENGQAVLRKELAAIYTDYTYGEQQWSYNHRWLDSNAFVEGYGNSMLHTYVGSCVHFSSLFALLLSHLGYDVRTISGAYINKTGPVGHTWNLVLVGNKYYWFDIRIDHSITQQVGRLTHDYFMKGDTDQWATKHIWARGYTDLLENHVAGIRALYEADEGRAHQWEDCRDGTATCETVGLWIESCAVCGLRRARYQAKGHLWQVLNERQPTCTKDGYQWVECRRCYQHENVILPATGHSWQLDQILTSAQDGGHGTASYRCGVCGSGKTARLCASEVFTDAPAEGNWAHEGVDYCFIYGLMSGTSPKLFSPQSVMSRAMAVQILWAAEGKPEPAVPCGFSDVRPGAWYEKAVAWAAENGLVNGVGDSKCAPNKSINRQELAVILWHYAQSKGCCTDAVADLSAYPDEADVSGWAEPAMEWAVATGLLSGTTSPSGPILAPKQCVTRAMAAVMLMRFLTSLE